MNGIAYAPARAVRPFNSCLKFAEEKYTSMRVGQTKTRTKLSYILTLTNISDKNFNERK